MADGLNPIANLLGKVNEENELVVSLDGGNPTFGVVSATGVSAAEGVFGTLGADLLSVGSILSSGLSGVTGTFTAGTDEITVTNGIITAITPA